MQSERKKLGQFNQMPIESLKSAHESKFKSQRKFQERENLFSKPYFPSPQHFPELQNMIDKSPFPMDFHEVFFLTTDPFPNKSRLHQSQNELLFTKEPQIQYTNTWNYQKQYWNPSPNTFVNQFRPFLINQSSDSQHQEKDSLNTNNFEN